MLAIGISGGRSRLVSIGLGALFVAISTHGSLFAQASSYGSSGGGGGGSFGSSSGAFSSGSSAFGSSGAFGSNSTTSGGLGGSANGANGANSGMVGMGGGGMYGGTGYGAQNGAAGRAGSNYSSSSQYGNRSAGQGQFGGGQGRQAGGSRRGGTGQTQGQGQYGQGGAGAGTKDQQPYFEPRIEIGFSVTTPAPTVIQTSIASPWHTPALTSRFGSVNVSVQGSTVTLRGTVPSEEDRQLAAQMAMLEPTVSSVQNDLRVAAPATPAAAPPR
jgi:hypothetical protein